MGREILAPVTLYERALRMRRPVVVIPGYYGSLLSDRVSGEVIWLDSYHLLRPDDTLDALRLDTGDPDRIVASGILDEVVVLPFWTPDVYKPLVAFLRHELGYGEQEVYSFYVDWRKSLDLAAADLARRIEGLIARTGSKQVDLIAHSHGGLVARRYLERSDPTVVKNLITLGTPHHGMLKTFAAMTRGIGVFTFSAASIRDVSRTFPSAYELLPSNPKHGLFKVGGVPSTPFADAAWLSSGASKKLLTEAHNVIKTLPPTLPVKGTFIYGTRSATSTQATATAAGKLTFTVSDDGDGTVPRVSASGEGIGGEIRLVPIPFGAHGSLFNHAEARRAIKDALLDRKPQPQFAFGFESGRMFRPRSLNDLAIELRDSNGALLPEANVHLKIKATKTNVELVASETGDYFKRIRMPGPGQHFEYEIIAKAPALDAPVVQRGVLFAGNY